MEKRLLNVVAKSENINTNVFLMYSKLELLAAAVTDTHTHTHTPDQSQCSNSVVKRMAHAEVIPFS